MAGTVRSVRMALELWEYVEARASSVEPPVSVNAWLVRMVALHKAGRLEVKPLPTDYPLKPMLPDQPKRTAVPFKSRLKGEWKAP